MGRRGGGFGGCSRGRRLPHGRRLVLHRERMAKIELGLDPDRPINRRSPSDRVKQLASDPARKIEAIKVYSEETGTGLAEAKEAVESFISNK